LHALTDLAKEFQRAVSVDERADVLLPVKRE
jgi:hypothetical protein